MYIQQTNNFSLKRLLNFSNNLD